MKRLALIAAAAVCAGRRHDFRYPRPAMATPRLKPHWAPGSGALVGGLASHSIVGAVVGGVGGGRSATHRPQQQPRRLSPGCLAPRSIAANMMPITSTATVAVIIIDCSDFLKIGPGRKPGVFSWPPCRGRGLKGR